MDILLTAYNGKILGPIAKLLGIIIDYIFRFLEKIGIPNVGLSIIIFTFFIYLVLLPLTFKQQKFSKMSAVMNPEIKKIQDKYKGKKDNESMQQQNAELQEVYAKYGVSPAGSCVQLVIQMPILFALYRVIANIPAYVARVKEPLENVATQVLAASNGPAVIEEMSKGKYITSKDFTLSDTVVDVLNKLSSVEWNSLKEQIPSVASAIDNNKPLFDKFNSFGPINIAESPSVILKAGMSNHAIILVIFALLIPFLAAATQWLNVIFMPQPAADDENNAMASSMKSMNLMMPIMSAVFCFTLPAGMGIYWIASAVVRCIEQIAINKYFDKMGLDKIIEKNKEKAAKKAEKSKSTEAKISSLKDKASIKTKNIDFSSDNVEKKDSSSNGCEKKGSLAEKAMLVKKFNDNN